MRACVFYLRACACAAGVRTTYTRASCQQSIMRIPSASMHSSGQGYNILGLWTDVGVVEWPLLKAWHQQGAEGLHAHMLVGLTYPHTLPHLPLHAPRSYPVW